MKRTPFTYEKERVQLSLTMRVPRQTVILSKPSSGQNTSGSRDQPTIDDDITSLYAVASELESPSGNTIFISITLLLLSTRRDDESELGNGDSQQPTLRIGLCSFFPFFVESHWRWFATRDSGMSGLGHVSGHVRSKTLFTRCLRASTRT